MELQVVCHGRVQSSTRVFVDSCENTRRLSRRYGAAGYGVAGVVELDDEALAGGGAAERADLPASRMSCFFILL